MISNLRDIVGYCFDTVDILILRHRWYRYCQLTTRIFSSKRTFVERRFQPRYERLIEWAEQRK